MSQKVGIWPLCNVQSTASAEFLKLKEIIFRVQKGAKMKKNCKKSAKITKIHFKSAAKKSTFGDDPCIKSGLPIFPSMRWPVAKPKYSPLPIKLSKDSGRPHLPKRCCDRWHLSMLPWASRPLCLHDTDVIMTMRSMSHGNNLLLTTCTLISIFSSFSNFVFWSYFSIRNNTAFVLSMSSSAL